MIDKLKIIVSNDDNIPTQFFKGKKRVTKIEFAKEVLERSKNSK